MIGCDLFVALLEIFGFQWPRFLKYEWVLFFLFCFWFMFQNFLRDKCEKKRRKFFLKKYKKPTRRARVSIIKVTQIALKVGNINFLRDSSRLSNSSFWLWLRTNCDNQQDGGWCVHFQCIIFFGCNTISGKIALTIFFLVWKINDIIWKG